VILVLEPDAALRAGARKLLSRAGHALLEAGSLDKAVVLADRNPIDVLLVGAAMQASIGDLRESLRARRPALRVALLPALPFQTQVLLERVERREPSAG
jgi:DNA-binding response OmpR family regulator